jgi:tryptophan 7-halogenase
VTPKKILIVGSGVAAWMTAARLSAVLNRDGRDFAAISVIDCPDSKTDSTDTSTLPDIQQLLAALGVDQFEFMRRVQATFRQSTKFVNWSLNEGEHFHHPLTLERPGAVDQAGRRWLMSNRAVPFANTVSMQPIICEMNLAPQMLGRWDFGRPLVHAFHVRTSLFEGYLKELSLARGVVQHSGELGDVDVEDDGEIAVIHSSSGDALTADLFIDCSGSSARLSGEKLGVSWVDCSQWLLCDAVTRMNVPYELHYPGFVRPYTTASAQSAGWISDVPLQNSRSLAYIHAGSLTRGDEAELELRNFEGPHSQDLSCESDTFKVGHREKSWVGNCISIGQANNFVEPLASTDLHLIDFAAAMLAEHFPYGDDMKPLAFRYNRIMVNRFYEAVDFVNMHYALSRRTDSTFWQQVREPGHINDRLQAKLGYWKSKPPTRADFEDQFFPGQSDSPLPTAVLAGDNRHPVDTAGLWTHENYEAVLFGMGFLNEECDAWYGIDRPDPGVLRHVLERVNVAQQKLPPHAIWLQRVVGMSDYPTI